MKPPLFSLKTSIAQARFAIQRFFATQRVPLIEELLVEKGTVTTVKMTVIGRPGKIKTVDIMEPLRHPLAYHLQKSHFFIARLLSSHGAIWWSIETLRSYNVTAEVHRGLAKRGQSE